MFRSIFVHNLLRKIYVKMSQFWKNAKNSNKNFFMNFLAIFMWVMVDENISPGSVSDTTSWSESSSGKKTHHFRPPTNLPTFLLNFLASFDIFALMVNKTLTYIFRDKKAPIVSYTTLTSEFSYLTWFLRYLHVHVRIRLDPILK